MTNSIDQLMGVITNRGGLMRGNMYLVKLPPSSVIGSEELNLVCKSVSVPGRNLNTTQRQIGMFTRNIVHGQAVGELSMTFRVMNDPAVLTYFNAWQASAVNRDTGEVGYYNAYVRDIEISILKKGVGLPLFKKEFDLPLPTFIKNRLPTIGPINFRQGEIDLDLVTNDKVAYKVRILEAYPAAVVGVTMSDDNMDGLIDINVSFSYKDWVTQSTDQPSGFLDSLFDIFDKFKIG